MSLKNLTKWLKVIKMFLNVSKNRTGSIQTKESMDCNLEIKLNVKRLYETNSVKYLSISIDNKFNWKSHADNIAPLNYLEPMQRFINLC